MQPQHCHACPVTWTKQYHTPTHIKCRFAKFSTVTTPSTQIPILYSNDVTKIWVKFPPIYLQLISYTELIQATLFTDNNISPRTRQHRPASACVGLFRDSSIHLPLFKSWQPSSQFRLYVSTKPIQNRQWLHSKRVCIAPTIFHLHRQVIWGGQLVPIWRLCAYLSPSVWNLTTIHQPN